MLLRRRRARPHGARLQLGVALNDAPVGLRSPLQNAHGALHRPLGGRYGIVVVACSEGAEAYGRARSRIKGEGNLLALFKVRPVVHHAIAAAGEKVLVYNVSLGTPIQEVRCSLKSLSRKCSRGGVREQATA